MSTVSDIIAFLEKFAPPQLAETWDNTGLLIGRRDAGVRKLLTCLTLTPDVAEEAVAEGVQFIVTHHPVLFRGTKNLTDADAEGKTLLKLIESGVAVYSPHTSFDSAADGINQQLAASIGLTNIQPLRPIESDENVGGGRTGILLQPVTLEKFLTSVGEAVSAAYIEYCGDLKNEVSRVGVACGAAAEFLEDAKRLNCDTFVTGESRFHSVLEARTFGVNLILLGHYSSERSAVENLAKTLATEFSGLDVSASQAERDPLELFCL